MHSFTKKVKESHGQLQDIREYCLNAVLANNNDEGFSTAYGMEQVKKDSEVVLENLSEVLDSGQLQKVESYFKMLFDLVDQANEKDNPLKFFELQSELAKPSTLRFLQEVQALVEQKPEDKNMELSLKTIYKGWLDLRDASDKEEIIDEIVYYDRFPFCGRVDFSRAEHEERMKGLVDKAPWEGSSVGTVGK